MRLPPPERELPYNLIIVTGSMRSGTSLLHRLMSTSPEAGPPIAPARYLADQLQIYRRYAGSDSPLATDYFCRAATWRK